MFYYSKVFFNVGQTLTVIFEADVRSRFELIESIFCFLDSAAQCFLDLVAFVVISVFTDMISE